MNQSIEQNVMDLVTFFEQKQKMPARSALAQPRAVRPDSAGRLLAMDGAFDDAALSQFQAQNQNYQIAQMPATPHSQARYGYPMTPQSIHRSGAPKALSIPVQHAVHGNTQGVYAPTANLNGGSPTYAQFAPNSADRASFPDLDSPLLQPGFAPIPANRRHARNHSTLSLASSVGSANSLLFPEHTGGYSDPRMSFAPQLGTPPSSPKKRKSPTKSPSKGKDKANHLDKAIMRDTGVTPEQINSYIAEENSAESKSFRCLWEGCTHTAARKENIRAHVQTHLGDRPYECPECHADFVRSHDFTRHYTTHVDSRDYKCPDCTQAFNRADALQRHRDRDFCNGLPPSSPTKVRRTMEAMDKKKDATARRTKKQAARRKTARRQASADPSEDFWSSSAGSPEYFSSDAGSPAMILDSVMETDPGDSSQHEPITRMDFGAPNYISDDVKLNRLLAALSEGSSTPSQIMSLSPPMSSPPMSPQQQHQTLTPFSPTPKRRLHKQHEMTPPASRDSMLGFATAPSVQGAPTFSTAPSLPDLSSASTSPLAFEPLTEFDDLLVSGNDSWLDQKLNKGLAEAPFDFGELVVDSKGPSAPWVDTDDDLFGPLL